MPLIEVNGQILAVDDAYAPRRDADSEDDNDTITTASDIEDSDYEPDSEDDEAESDSSFESDDSDMENEFPTIQEDIVEDEDEDVLADPDHRGQREHTAMLWRALEDDPEPLPNKISDILQEMKRKGIDIAIFFRAFSWGTDDCISHPVIRQARSVLMNSKELPEILEAWYQPPRPRNGTNSRPRGAKEAIQSIAQRCMSDLVEKELVSLYKLVYKDSKMMKENEVTSVHIEQLTSEMRGAAPTLWGLLETMASTKSQKKRNTRKRPEKVRRIVDFSLYSRY